MTAEHDGRAEHAGMDALMAAIIDEPLSDTARADAAFMAEHRSAEADLVLLREQLGLIGQALTEPGKAPEAPEAAEAPEPVPVRPSRTRRRVLNLAFGGLAVAAAAAVLSGMAWLLAQAGGGISATSDDGGGNSEASQKEADGVRFGSPRYLACARTVAEGTVTRVDRLPGGEQLRVTVHVTHSYKPEKGEDELTYVISRYDVSRPLEQGDQVLFGVRQDAAAPDYWAVGEREVARERAWITASLPESRTLTCT